MVMGVPFPLTPARGFFEPFLNCQLIYIVNFALGSDWHLRTLGSEECKEVEGAISRGCWRRIVGDFVILAGASCSVPSTLVEAGAFSTFLLPLRL